MASTKAISKLLGNSERTVKLWKSEGRSIIKFINMYLTDKQIEEFLESNKINDFNTNGFLPHILSDIKVNFFNKITENQKTLFIDFIVQMQYKFSDLSNEWIFQNIKRDLIGKIKVENHLEEVFSILLAFDKLTYSQQLILSTNINSFIPKKDMKPKYIICIMDDNKQTALTVQQCLEWQFDDDVDLQFVVFTNDFDKINFDKDKNINLFIIDYQLSKSFTGIDVVNKYKIPKTKAVIFSGDLMYKEKLGSIRFFDKLNQADLYDYIGTKIQTFLKNKKYAY